MLFLAAVLTATHALVTALRVAGVPGLPGSGPRTALLEFLAALLLYDLPHAALGWCALRRKTAAVWAGAAHSALGLAWLAAAVAGAPWARFALEAEEAAPGPGVGLSLGVPALLFAAAELVVVLAALPAAACASRNPPGASCTPPTPQQPQPGGLILPPEAQAERRSPRGGPVAGQPSPGRVGGPVPGP
jgi:hypothetical protein